MNQDVLVAIYGIIQADLRDGYLDAYGATHKDKNDSELTSDAKAVYEWLRIYLKHLSQKDITMAGEKFNVIAISMEQEYQMNMFMLAIFMFEDELGARGTNPQKIVLMPKLNRIIKNMRSGIMTLLGDGFDIVRDSKIGASNVVRRFHGLPELTKQMREWKRLQWHR